MHRYMHHNNARGWNLLVLRLTSGPLTSTRTAKLVMCVVVHTMVSPSMDVCTPELDQLLWNEDKDQHKSISIKANGYKMLHSDSFSPDMH